MHNQQYCFIKFLFKVCYTLRSSSKISPVVCIPMSLGRCTLRKVPWNAPYPNFVFIKTTKDWYWVCWDVMVQKMMTAVRKIIFCGLRKLQYDIHMQCANQIPKHPFTDQKSLKAEIKTQRMPRQPPIRRISQVLIDRSLHDCNVKMKRKSWGL